MSGYMAADVDRARHPGDMGGIGLDLHSQGCGLPAKSLGADAQGVDALQ